MSHKQPQRYAGRAFAGWRLSFDRKSVGKLFPSSSAAKDRAQELATYDLAWDCRATDPEGRSHYEGGHPRVIPGPPMHVYDTVRGLQDADDVSQAARRDIGEAARRDRWHIAPTYRDLFEPVPGAIRPFLEARFYVAPDHERSWSIWADGSTSVIESFHSKETALSGARRLAAGVQTERTVLSTRKQVAAFAALIALTVLMLAFSIWHEPGY